MRRSIQDRGDKKDKKRISILGLDEGDEIWTKKSKILDKEGINRMKRVIHPG